MLDCRQWARVARAAGFQIAILTAKHHDGFCLWPSRWTDHSVRSSPWRQGNGDVVREFVDAFRAEGLKVGFYLSPWDRHESSYGAESYNDFYCGQLEELLTGYGEWHEVWFDGACGEGPNGKVQFYDWPRMFRMVRDLQPGAVTFGDGGTDVRWVGNERGLAGETCWATRDGTTLRFPGDSGICQANDARASVDKEKLLNEGDISDGRPGLVWQPAECDVSIRPGWFYHESEDGQVRSAADLVELYSQSVGRNGTLLLNIPPAPSGLLHFADVAVVLEFRRRLEAIFTRNLAAEVAVAADRALADHPAEAVCDPDPATFWAAPDGSRAVLEIRLPQPVWLGLISLGEPVQYGQRISRHSIEAGRQEDGSLRKIVSGTTIGMRRLHRFPSVLADRIRLTVEDAFAPPALCRFTLYAPYPDDCDL